MYVCVCVITQILSCTPYHNACTIDNVYIVWAAAVGSAILFNVAEAELKVYEQRKASKRPQYHQQRPTSTHAPKSHVFLCV